MINRMYSRLRVEVEDRGAKIQRNGITTIDLLPIKIASMQLNHASNDLTSGRMLQRSLLPQALPAYPGLDIAAEVWTAVDLGGDYYQFLEQPGLLAVAIADSSGKSVAGAIHAALFKGQLDAYASQGKLQNPISVLNSLNHLLCRSRTEDAVALAYGALDFGSYEMHLGNAGIPGPIIYRAAQRGCEEVVNPGIALGRFGDTSYRATTRSLNEGDVVVFFSDGLTEATNSKGDEFSELGPDGLSPLQKAIIRLADRSAPEIRDGLKVALDEFSGQEIPDDDVSIVVIKLNQKVPLSLLRNCPYQEALQVWIRSEERDESALLRGARLAEALKWAHGQKLSHTDTEFLEASKRTDEREQMQAQLLEAAQVRAAAADRLEKLSRDLAKSLESEKQHRLQAEMGELNERIVALTMSSEALYLSNNHLEALIATTIGGVQLKKLTSQLAQRSIQLKPNTQIRTTTALEQVVYGINEYNRLEGHGFWVNRVSFNPHGNLIASCSSDRSINVWDTQGKLLQRLYGHTNWVTSVEFSPDGNTLASASRDNTLKLWYFSNDESGLFADKATHTLKGHDGPVLDVSFSPDGELIASASEDTTIRIWKINGSLMRTLRGGHSRWATCVSFSPVGDTIASGSADRTIILWHVNGTPIRTLKGHDSFVESISFSPDGQLLVSASRDKTVKLWNIDGTLLKTFHGHTDKVWDADFHPDGRTIASASWDRTIKIWDIEGALLKTFKGHGDVVHSITFSPDGRTLASGSRDTTVKLWNITGTQLHRLVGHTDEIYSLAVSPDGLMLASVGKDRQVNLWNMKGKLLASLSGHNDRIHSVCFSPDGQTVVSASGDSTLMFWQSRNGKLINTLKGHRSEVYGICYRPDGQVLASCSADTTVRIWTAEGTWLQTLSEHGGEVYSVAFSADGSMIASASKDKTVKLWNWNGSLIRTFEGHSAEVLTVCFSPDNQTIASGSMDQSVRLWSLDGTLLKTLNGHSAEVRSVCFSPDGKALASGGEDTLVQLWSIDGTLLRTFNGHTGAVKSLCFRPNSKALISASDDRTIIIWNLDMDNLLMRGCQWLQEYLKTNTNVAQDDRRTCLGGCSWLFKHLQSNNSGQTQAQS
jgi:WD40 repeat protein/serine phosphatase RsbU (regulator of sigma subunit)